MAVPVARTPPAPPVRRGMVASAVKVDPGDSNFIQRRTLDWQAQAFYFTKHIPELNFASRFYAKMLSKIRIYPAIRGADESLTPITEGLPVELLDRIQDPGGGRSHILSSYGRLMFIAGEGFLFGYDLNLEGKERWKFVSTQELVFDGSKITWRPEEGKTLDFKRGSSAEAYRMWMPDPEQSGMPESPMRAVIEIAQELEILTKAVAATAISRMTSGILKIPQELSLDGEIEPGQEEDPQQIPLLRRAIEHFTGVVENAGSPEAAAPWMVEGADEFLERLQWISTHDVQNDYMERELRKEAIERSAIGLDLPPEFMKGYSSANHWAARQIMHDTWRSYGINVAEQFVDDLGEAYMRPALIKEDYDGWEQVVVAFDDSNVVIPPDRTDDADKAWDRMNVNGKFYRRMKGIPENEKQTEEETRIQLAIKMKDPAFLVGTTYELEEPEPAPEDPGPPPSTDADPEAEEGPADPGPAGVTRRESRAAAVQAAAMMGLIRCRELAGSKIRSQLQRRGSDMVEQVNGKPNALVASIIGQERLKEFATMDPLRLVQGGMDGFCGYLVDEWSFTPAQATALGEMLLMWAARTLFDHNTPQLPAGFLAQMERMQEVTEAMVKGNNDSLEQLGKLVQIPG